MRAADAARAVVVAGLVPVAAALGGCATALRPLTTTDAATDLEQVTRSSGDETDPSASPDGRALAYASASAKDTLSHLVVVSLVGGRRVLFDSKDTPGADPTWTPDGASVVFVSRAADARPRLLETYGQGVRPVFLADVGDAAFVGGTRPAVSADGKLVAMSLGDLSVLAPGARAARRYHHALAVTDLVGTGVRVVATGTDVAYSPEGRHMAFVRESRGHEHVFVAAADGSGAVQVTHGSEDDESPTFSPDGASIAFCAKVGEPPAERANLFVVRLDGSGLVQLTEGDRVACKPSWAGDGLLYFHANAGASGRFHVFRLRPRGRVP